MTTHVHNSLALIVPLAFFVKLYRTLEANPEEHTEKFTIKTPNLTVEEAEFLHKVINYDTEQNLKYLILNKTQEMYTQNYEKLYKQAEGQVAYNDDHLRIKYYHYFIRHQTFETIYYPFVEKFFFKVLRFVPEEVKKLSRFDYYPELGHNRDEFLQNEEFIEQRINIIRKIFEDALKAHYVLVDDLDVFNFVNNTRPKLDAFFESEQYFQLLKDRNITLVKDLADAKKNKTAFRRQTKASVLNLT